MADEQKVLMYKGRPLMRKDNLIYYGSMADSHIVMLQILETKKIGDMAEEYGVQMNIHMAESPIACLAAVHVAAATRNFMSLELHSVDVPWWGDLVIPSLKYDDGFITVPDAPGLGIEALNEELIKSKLHPEFPEAWASTAEWDKEWSNDRQWS